MSTLVLIAALFVPLLLAVVATVVWLVLSVARRDRHTAGGEWSLVRATRVLGLVGGAVAAAYVVDPFVFGPLGALAPPAVTDLGRGLVLAPAVFGLVVLLSVALGETVVRQRRTTGPRTASLRPRRLSDYLPRLTTRLVAVLGAALLATLVLTTATASPDDLGRDGRALSCLTDQVGQARTPYPGAFYSVPLAVLLLVVVAVALLAARQAVLRPRGSATTELDDDELRRRSVTVIVAATGVALGLTLAGVAFGAGTAMTGLDTCDGWWQQPVGVLMLALSAVGALAGCWCLVRLLGGDPTRSDAR